MLGLFGGADEGITADVVAAYEAALDKAGAAHELITYPGAPDSFFDRRQSDFAAASDDAWRRFVDFVASPAS